MKTEKQFCRELCGYQVPFFKSVEHAEEIRSLAERAGFKLFTIWLLNDFENVVYFRNTGRFLSCPRGTNYPTLSIPQLREIVEKWEKANEKPEVEQLREELERMRSLPF